MSNVTHSEKAKLKRNPKPSSDGAKLTGKRLTSTGSSGRRLATASSPATGNTFAGKAVHKVTGPMLKAGTGAKLQAGAELLTTAVSSYAARSGSGAADREEHRSHAFQKAYSSLISAVPKKHRLDVLRQMRQGLEELTRLELKGTLDRSVDKDNKQPVSTADFMAGLEQQEQEQRDKDIASKKLIPGAEMRARLGVSAQALSAALKAKRMFVMQGSSGEYLYPGFFTDRSYDRPVLEKVCKALGELPGAVKWDFFMSPRISLGGKTPLDALAKGKVDDVLAAANAFRER